MAGRPSSRPSSRPGGVVGNAAGGPFAGAALSMGVGGPSKPATPAAGGAGYGGSQPIHTGGAVSPARTSSMSAMASSNGIMGGAGGVAATTSPKEATYTFVVEWNDIQASLVRKYNLYYYALDDTIEMFDLKARRTFLKRTAYPSIHLDDLYIGAQVTIYSRPIKILGYADEFTAARLASTKSRTLALVVPEAISQVGLIIDTINKSRFIIGRMRMVQLTAQQAATFFNDGRVTERANNLSRGPVVALEVIGSGVGQALKDLAASDEKSGLAGVYLSPNDRQAEAELAFLLDNANIGSTAQFASCTTCVIKPHAVLAGYTGRIIDAIMSDGKYQITALQQFTLDRAAAEELLEVYKGVIPEYGAMVEHYTSGPCIALELRGDDAVVQSFREMCGPSDPEIARHIRPNTLRAAFGKNKVKNALHCTDLPEDGPLESEYFFSILQKQAVVSIKA